MQATPIHFMTVREQADLLASGEITSVELTRHFLDRAAELVSRTTAEAVRAFAAARNTWTS